MPVDTKLNLTKPSPVLHAYSIPVGTKQNKTKLN